MQLLCLLVFRVLTGMLAFHPELSYGVRSYEELTQFLTLSLHLAVGWRTQSKPSSSEKDSNDENKKDGPLLPVQLSNFAPSVAFQEVCEE